MKHSVGRYKDVDYRRQRICDVMLLPYLERFYFTYDGGVPTGDYFKTIGELKRAIDSGQVSAADSVLPDAAATEPPASAT